MKSLGILFIVTLFFISCSSSDLKKEINCTSTTSFSNLEKTEDIRNLFTVSLPKNWKVKLYYDNSQTSIYAADTTKNLTQSTLIDITLIHKAQIFDTAFQQKIIQENTTKSLKNIQSKKIIFLNKPSFYSLSKGKKRKYSYQILTVFSKVNSDNFLHSKVEVYGDSLITERFCKAIDLLEKIELK